MKCVDTTFLIDLLHNRPGAVSKAQELDHEDKVITTQINVYELLYGIYRKKGAKVQPGIDAVNRILDKLDVLPFDRQAAIEAAKIAGRLSKKGLTIGSHDCMIAGISITNGCKIIITENVDHFKRIKGITIETY